jgi:hypothetical protein
MTRVVLAAAHLDKDPANSRLSNLWGLCQRCHMRFCCDVWRLAAVNCERESVHVSGGNFEQFGDEPRLGLDVATTDVLNLSLPDHCHRLVAGQRSSSRPEVAKASPGQVSRFTFRWSCSTILFRCFTCRSRERRQSPPAFFISVTAFG